MKILIIGAGVIGSTYGYRFIEAGHQVTFLEKSSRLLELSDNGLSVCQDSDGLLKTTNHFRLINSINRNESYDLILVTVRYDHLESVLNDLSHNPSANILFMLNNPGGSKIYLRFFDQARIILGFPGVGGKKEYGIVHYHLLSRWIQPTTIGEIQGKTSKRILRIKNMLREVGFHVSVNPNMDTWYLTHLAVVCPLANAIYLDGGNNYTLAKNRHLLKLLARTIKESLDYVHRSKGEINPARFKFMSLLPENFLVKILSWTLNTRWAETVISSHSRVARMEMEKLSQDFLSQCHEGGHPMPNFRKLMFNERLDQKIEKLLWISSTFFNCLF